MGPSEQENEDFLFVKAPLERKRKEKKYPLKYCLLPRGKDTFLDWTPKDVGLNKDVRTNSVLFWDHLFAKNPKLLKPVK